MALVANLTSGQRVSAEDTRKENAPFHCHICGGEMTFVSGQKRLTKHFRHRVESNCEWEPETEQHIAGKYALRDAINSMGKGSADVEQRVGDLIADVLWKFGNQRIAFEIQAAAYEWRKFEEKIEAYRAAEVAVVYLFVGKNFGGKLSQDRIRIREIEKRLLVGESRFTRRARDYPHKCPELHRVVRQYRDHQPHVTAGYLFRSKSTAGQIVVREPQWVHAWDYNGSFLKDHVLEAGRISTPLQDYLSRLAEIFLSPKTEGIWLHGVHYLSKADAHWGHVFRSLKLPLRYRADIDGGLFETVRGNPLRAKVGKWPEDFDGSTICLPQRPTFRFDLCSTGQLDLRISQDASSTDEAVLGGWQGSSPGWWVADFCQLNNSYSGTITGLHDGGTPGGNYGIEVAQAVKDAWEDAAAVLSSGIAYPIALGFDEFLLSEISS